MTAPTIAEYLPIVKGHIVNEYKWMGERGNCMITIDDLIQIASIALITLVKDWDAELAKTIQGGVTLTGEDAEKKLFWSHLRRQVKWRVTDYYNTHVNGGLSELDVPIPEEGDEWENRATLRIKPVTAHSHLLLREISDFYAMLPQRDRIHLALQYFDELPVAQIGDILGQSKDSLANYTGRVVARWRQHVHNVLSSHPEVDVAPRKATPWEAPESLHAYLESRHRMDIHEYLGITTIAFREDLTYVVNIVGTERIMSPYADGYARKRVLSPFQATQADVMLAAGMTQQAIADRLGVNRWNITAHAKRRHSIA